MSFYVTFTFESKAPTPQRVFSLASTLSDRVLTIEISDSPGWFWIWHQGETDFNRHGAAITLQKNQIVVSCSMYTGVWQAVRDSIRDLGGVTPPPIDPQEPNPVYGELWDGVVMEHDDWIIEWENRSFVIVDFFIEFVYDDEEAWVEVGFPFQTLQEQIEVGVTIVDEAFDRAVEVAAEQANRLSYDDTALVALKHLLRFLREARENGSVVTVREL